jgi:hypothetical protein
MLSHAFTSYMRHAYPADELKPLSCVGRQWDRRERGTLDDCLGGYALTLIDSLSSLALVRRQGSSGWGEPRAMVPCRLPHARMPWHFMLSMKAFCSPNA